MKNLKSIITNSCSIILGALVYGFLALPVFTYTYSSTLLGVSETAGSSTGYDVIKNLFEGGDSNFAGSLMAISMFVLSIAAGLMILVSIFNLLTQSGLVKVDQKLSKAMKITNFVLSAVLAVFAIVAISCTASYLASGLNSSVATAISEALAALGMTVDASTILAALGLTSSIASGMILNLIVCIASLVPTALELFPCKKSKK